MLQLAFFFLFFQVVFSLDRCPGKRTNSCASISKSSTCTDYYEFSWNTTTMKPLARPKLCYVPSSGTKCGTKTSVYCEPPCMLNNIKVGVASTPQADAWPYKIASCYTAYENLGLCKSVYVHEDNGDQWCYEEKYGYTDGPNNDGWICSSPSWTCHN